MSAQEDLDPEFVQSVVAHMNEDHAESCLSIVRAFSNQTSASEAVLHDLDRQSLYFKVKSDVGSSSGLAASTIDVKIKFPLPLRNERQVRNALIGMASQARDALSS